jgi:hypothetical protein
MDNKAPLPLAIVALLAVMSWSRGAPPNAQGGAAPAAREGGAGGAGSTRAGIRERAGGSGRTGSRRTTGGPAGAGGSAATAPEARETPEHSAPEGWREPLRLYGEFFGLEEPAHTEGGRDDVARSAARLTGAIRDGYELEFMIALVPDPIDSQMPASFDQALDGIQRGLANVDVADALRRLSTWNGRDNWDQSHLASFPWLLDRSWLPWTEAAGDQYLYRQAPGLLLFRKFDQIDPAGAPARRLMGVFLVGETPKRGIHQAAFREALRLILALGGEHGAASPLRIVGPTFSGSAESLRLGLLNARRSLHATMQVSLVTGSATAAGLEELFADREIAPVEFFRTVLPDKVLETAALRELHRTMGWDLCKLALITESDTAYGQGIERERIMRGLMRDDTAASRSEPCERSSQNSLESAMVLHFPSHLSAIRSASEAAAARRPAAPAELVAAQSPTTEIDLSLAESGTPADRVPELSPLTAADNEQAVATLLGAISREGIGYVGILASDVRDRLFLADRIRRFAPDVTLFTLDADLLFAHRQVHASMDDMVVLSTFQLFTEGGVGMHAVDLDPHHRRQFTSELEEGVFHAVRALIDPIPLAEQPAARRDPVMGWISVASGGALWPVLSVKIGRSELPALSRAPGSPAVSSILALEDPDSQDIQAQGKAAARDQPLSARADLGLLLLALALGGLAFTLRRTALTPEITAEAGGQVASSRGLLCLGLGLLAVTGAFVLVLEAMEYFSLPLGRELAQRLKVDPYPVAARGPAQWICLLALIASYLFLVWCFAAAWRRGRLRMARTARMAWGAGWLAAAAGVVAALWIALLGWFIPGEIEYFELRSRVFSSGLSPIISLGWLVAALSVWVLLELKRRGLIAWQQVDWPLTDSWDPALRGSHAVAERLERLVCRTLPSSWRFRAGMAALLAAALGLVWANVQPIGETPAYARIFLLALVASTVLGMVSWWRFWRAWQLLRTLLLRVEQTPLLRRFAALQAEVGWKPMQSFGWAWPGLNLLVLSTRRLQELERPDRPPLLERASEPYQEQLADALARSFDSGGSKQGQVAARRRLERLLREASREVRSAHGEADVEDFIALRVVAYVRYLFSQLRSYLIGGLFPLLLLLFAVSAYAFEPKRFFSFGLLGTLGLVVVVTLGMFVAMDRNVVLRRMGGDEGGGLKFDRAFFGNLLTYGLVPLLGLLATQVPEAGQLLNDWLKPLLRIVGVG